MSSKVAVAEAVTASGLHTIDAGALSWARGLEAIRFLQIALAAVEKLSWNGGFAVIA